MSSVLVTGASGFIGSHICDLFLARGWRVVAMVRRTSDASRLQRPGIELVYADLSTRRPIPLPPYISHVVHSASVVSDTAGADECRQTVVDGTRHLASTVRRQCPRLERFVYISTALVLGYGSDGISERRPGRRSASFVPYVRAKRAAEELLRAEHRSSGLPLVILRPTDVLGPRDRTSCRKMCEAVEQGRPMLVGRGDSRTAFCTGEEVAQAAWLACTNPAAVGHAYTLAGRTPVSWHRLLGRLASGLGCRPPRAVPAPAAFWFALVLELARQYLPMADPAVSYYRFRRASTSSSYDIADTASQLGFAPDEDIDAKLDATVDWYRSCKADI